MMYQNCGLTGQKKMGKFEVISGKYKGKIGNLVSIPWIGNLWNLRLQLNCCDLTTDSEVINYLKKNNCDYSKLPPRTWINVWRWQVERIK